MTSRKSYCVLMLILVLSVFSRTAKAGSFTASGSTLNLDLNVASQLVTVVSTGTTYTFTLSGGATNTWTGTTSTSITVSGAVLTVTATGLTTFNTINITDSQTGTAVAFATSGANSYADHFNITLDNSPAAVNFSGSSSFSGSNALSVTTSMNITFNSLSSLSTVNGNLTLDANTQASPNSMSYAGIYMDSSTVQITGTGVLTVTARGGGNTSVTAPQSAGIAVVKGSKLIGGTTGTATILGRSYTGVAGSTSGIGVYVSGGNASEPARISSNGADVSVTGYGAVSTAVVVANQYNCGVVVGSATTTASTTLYGSLTAGGSGTVTIVGYGGSAANPASAVSTHCYGVIVSSTNALITTGGGNLSITGTGGGSDTLSDYNHGVVVNRGAIYPGGTNANLEVTGTGGNSSGGGGNGNNGVNLGTGGAGQIKGGLGTGSALITGYGGGRLASVGNNGVVLTSGSIITSLGTGTVTVKGYGGNASGTGGTNSGVKLAGIGVNPCYISSNGGNVLVEGTGGGGPSTSFNIGVYAFSISYITAGGSGTVTINGTGGNKDGISGSSNYGVYVSSGGSGQVEAYITSGGGNVTITGTGGGGSANSASGSNSATNYGVFAELGGYITAGGTGSVNITGTGGNSSTGATGGSNIGVYIGPFAAKSTNLYSTQIISGGGNIVINGYGGGNGTSATNYGVQVKGMVKAFGSGTVTINGIGGTTTTGANNGGVAVDGAPNVNAVIYPATVTSEGGAVTITGTGGGTGTSTSNYGTYVNAGGVITAGSNGAVSVTGTGGGGLGTGQQNYGVYVNGGTSPNFSTITSGGGSVSVTGTGPQNTGGANQHGVFINGAVINSGANGNVTVTGTAGIGDVLTIGNGHIGVQLSGAAGLISSGGTGTVTVNGTGGGHGARANNYGVLINTGSGITSGGAGSVTINGTGGNGTGSNSYGLIVTGTNSRINSGGGDITINTTEGASSSSLATALASAGIISSATNGGNIIIKGNSFNTVAGCTIAAPASGSIKFIPLSNATPIAFTATADAKGSLNISSTELATMSAGTLLIGNSSTGPITVNTTVDLSTAPQSNLTLLTASSGGGLKPKSSSFEFSMADGKSLNLAGTNSLIINITGTTVNTQYDQLSVSGTIDLTGLTLSLTGAYTPVPGNVFTIVSATSLSGTFTGLSDGSTVTFNGRTLIINYTSTTVTLTDFSPLITSQPSNQTVTAGSSASFSATATGTPTPTVQWQKSTNGGSTWADIDGATSTTYNFTTAAGDHSNQYQAIFTNTYGSDTTNAVTLTVNTVPLVSAQPSNSTVLAGATASFTATATGSPAPTVQWQVSTDGGSNWTAINGAISTSYTTGALSLTDNNNKYRAVFTNAAGTVNTDAAVLTVNATSLSWNGSVSTDWNNPANWTPNGIPVSGASITIPVGLTNYPVLDQSRSTNSLTVASGINLSVGSSSLTVTGDLTNNGTIAGTGSIILSGTSAQTISGTGTISNLTINNANGVSISSGSNRQTITGMLTPAAGTLTTNGNLTLKSDANGTARITEGSGNYISGNVEVERYIGTNQRAWRLLSIPMTGATIREAWAGTAANSNANGTNESAGSGTLITGHGYTTGAAASAAGFDWFNGLNSSSTSSIRYYNNNNWNSTTNTPDITAAPDKQGYMLYVRGDRTVASNAGSGTTTLRPSGALKINTQTVSISNNYEVVGNPYASPIDLDAMYNNTGNSAVIERNFWVWDATLGSNGGFRALSSSGGNNYTMTGGSGSASDYLKVQSGQAFFVKKAASGNITIEENNKIGGSSPIVFGVATPITGTVGLVRVELNNAINQLDGVAVRFNDGYQSAPTETYDMAKLNNFNENLSLVNGSSYLSIDSRPYPTAKDTVRLAFWNLAPNTYTLQLSSSNLNGRIGTAMLLDNFTNTSQPINLTGDTTRYSFAVTANAASSSLNRFTVIFGQQASLPVHFLQISASTKATGISVRWNTSQESELSRYEVERSADGVAYSKIGMIQPNNSATSASYEWLDMTPKKGHNFYRIKSVNQNANFNYSTVVKADWSRLATVELLPTITTDGLVTLVMRAQPLGKYQVQLRAVNGALVYKKTLDHSNVTGVYELKLGEGGVQLVQGIYWLELSNGKGVRQQFKVVKN